MQQTTDDCIKTLKKGVDLRGICIYPVLDRPDWDELHNIECGIWSYDPVTGERSVEPDYLACVRQCHEKINRYLKKKETVKLKVPVQRSQPVATF